MWVCECVGGGGEGAKDGKGGRGEDISGNSLVFIVLSHHVH